MKKFSPIDFILYVVLALTIATTIALTIAFVKTDTIYQQIHSELNLKQAEIEYLEKQTEMLGEEVTELKEDLIYSVNVENDYWNHISTVQYEGLHGTITFDDLTKIEYINVSYRDVMFNIVETSNNIISMGTDNTVLTLCYYDYGNLPAFCELEVFYKSGKFETIIIRIAMV